MSIVKCRKPGATFKVKMVFDPIAVRIKCFRMLKESVGDARGKPRTWNIFGGHAWSWMIFGKKCIMKLNWNSRICLEFTLEVCWSHWYLEKQVYIIVSNLLIEANLLIAQRWTSEEVLSMYCNGVRIGHTFPCCAPRAFEMHSLAIGFLLAVAFSHRLVTQRNY